MSGGGTLPLAPLRQGSPVPLAFLPLIAVVLIASLWFVGTRRSRQEPVTSVAQFQSALTALAPRETDDA